MKLKEADGAIGKELLAYCDSANTHWTRIRTENVIETKPKDMVPFPFNSESTNQIVKILDMIYFSIKNKQLFSRDRLVYCNEEHENSNEEVVLPPRSVSLMLMSISVVYWGM